MWEHRRRTGEIEQSGGMASPLDNPTWASLTGPHARFAERRGRVLRYPEDVAPFLGLPDDPGEQDWRDVAELGGPGAVVVLAATAARPPAGWEVLDALPGRPARRRGRRGRAGRRKPCGWGSRTCRRCSTSSSGRSPGRSGSGPSSSARTSGSGASGALVAMAGERLHPPGYTEISAVCTDPAYRGQGLATRLVLAVAAGIRERGETPMMHAAASNTSAIRLYLSLGFVLRRRPDFVAVRVPAKAPVEEPGRTIISTVTAAHSRLNTPGDHREPAESVRSGLLGQQPLLPRQHQKREHRGRDGGQPDRREQPRVAHDVHRARDAEPEHRHGDGGVGVHAADPVQHRRDLDVALPDGRGEHAGRDGDRADGEHRRQDVDREQEFRHAPKLRESSRPRPRSGWNARNRRDPANLGRMSNPAAARFDEPVAEGDRDDHHDVHHHPGPQPAGPARHRRRRRGHWACWRRTTA